MRTQIALAVLLAAFTAPAGLAANEPEPRVVCAASGSLLRCAPVSTLEAAEPDERLGARNEAFSLKRRNHKALAALLVLAERSRLLR